MWVNARTLHGSWDFVLQLNDCAIFTLLPFITTSGVGAGRLNDYEQSCSCSGPGFDGNRSSAGWHPLATVRKRNPFWAGGAHETARSPLRGLWNALYNMAAPQSRSG